MRQAAGIARRAGRQRDRDRGCGHDRARPGGGGCAGRGACGGEEGAVIVPPGGVRVLVATRPVDFRKGMDGLAALAKETLAQDPFSGAILVFRAKRADRVKLLFWDGSGLLLVSKRLEQGAFKWPPITDGVMRLSAAQLAALIEGLDWTRVHVPRVLRPQAQSWPILSRSRDRWQCWPGQPIARGLTSTGSCWIASRGFWSLGLTSCQLSPAPDVPKRRQLTRSHRRQSAESRD